MKDRFIKIIKNNKLKLLSIIFGLVFIVSLFTSIKVLAQTPTFVIESASVSSKSSAVSGNITYYDNDSIDNLEAIGELV